MFHKIYNLSNETYMYAMVFCALLSFGNPSMDTITFRIKNFNGYTGEVCKWVNDLITHLMMGVIIYPCWD